MTALWSLLLAGGWAQAAPAEEDGVSFFEKKIRPVLVAKCYSCHAAGAKSIKGGLLLDSREGIRRGGDSGPAVVPGKPEDSLLLAALAADGSFYDMPPDGKLPEEVVADFRRWIERGAPDPREAAATRPAAPSPGVAGGKQFWAFQPPRPSALPACANSAWPAARCDAYILARLEQRSLAPSPPAERSTLLRRLYYDLLGLPPDPEELREFLAVPEDEWEAAYDRLVDRLLASPHFGERWGRHWLDVARFADSSGGGRTLLFPSAWRYRDYVVDFFNADRSFFEFVQEQVCGDLLPAASSEVRERQLIATAFLALGPTNYEGQDKDLLEMDVIDEQLETVGRAFMGMTIGCARCHDHKFDPIPTRDYYALAGIFRSTETLIHDNVSRWVDTPLPLPEDEERRIQAHEAQLAALQADIKEVKGKLAELDKAGDTVPAALPPAALPGIVVDDSQAKRVGEWNASQYSGRFIGDGYLHDGNSAKGEKTLTFVPDALPAGRYEVRFAYTSSANRATNTRVTVFHADGEDLVTVNQRETPPLDGRFVPLGSFRFETNGQGFVLVSNEQTDGHVIADAVQFLPADAAAGPAPPPPAVPDDQQLADVRAELKRLETQLKQQTEQGPKRPQAMSVREHSRIADCPILIRGNLSTPGPVAPRGFLSVATAGPAPEIGTQESGRRQLAEWLTSDAHPLTARVTANRIWHWLFGRGLVRTVDNFGSTGELPSHPELLDELALSLHAEHGSIKRLVRRVVHSRTYRQSSQPTAALRAADPENRLFARMNRRRLDAEAVRDTMLHASGQLDLRLGGPNIAPGTTIEYGYTFSDTRRSLYTPVFRNTLLELFEAFDFADPNQVVGRRNASTTATQALYLMNHPFPRTQAQLAAERLLRRGGLDDSQRIRETYHRLLGREPSDSERTLLLKHLARPEVQGPEERLRAWTDIHHGLFSCLDFRYLD